MAMNKIIKYNLKSKAISLKEKKKTNGEIASILSKDSNIQISISSVLRFFDSYDKEVQEAISKNEQLQAKVAEVEINSIQDWLDDIQFLSDLASDAWSAGDYRSAQMAMKTKIEAREGVNRQLGRISGNQGVTVNNINAMKIEEIPKDQLRGWMDEIRSLRAR